MSATSIGSNNSERALQWSLSETLGLTESEMNILGEIERKSRPIRETLLFTATCQEIRKYDKKNWFFIDESGEKHLLPRTIYMTKKSFIIALKGHSGAPTSKVNEQSVLKLGYDLTSGKYFVKKKIYNMFQKMFLSGVFLDGNRTSEQTSFPECALVGSGFKYFERKYDYDLSGWMKVKSCQVLLKNIILLQNAINELHAIEYVGAQLIRPDGEFAIRVMTNRDQSGYGFHGDISPKNIYCSEDPQFPGYPQYKLGGFRFSADFCSVVWTPGWGSPEAVAYALKDPRYAKMSPEEFNRKYGQKKDTWAFGLLVGSLLRKGFYPHIDHPLPNFSFIKRKLKEKADGEWDESALPSLTQKEVDEKIVEIISQLPQNEHTEQFTAWWKVINIWLRVNPDERPTLKEVSLFPI